MTKNFLLNPLCTQFSELGSDVIFLPAGEELYRSLVEKWREMHKEMGFEFVYSQGHYEGCQLHSLVFDMTKRSLPFKLAHIGPGNSDFASIFCEKREDVHRELISSLHFLRETIKIFGFETRVYLLSPTCDSDKEKILLVKALDELKIAYLEEPGTKAKVEFRLLERSGKELVGPFVAIKSDYDEEISLIYRSLFGSIERWMAMLLEQRSKR